MYVTEYQKKYKDAVKFTWQYKLLSYYRGHLYGPEYRKDPSYSITKVTNDYEPLVDCNAILINYKFNRYNNKGVIIEQNVHGKACFCYPRSIKELNNVLCNIKSLLEQDYQKYKDSVVAPIIKIILINKFTYDSCLTNNLFGVQKFLNAKIFYQALPDDAYDPLKCFVADGSPKVHTGPRKNYCRQIVMDTKDVDKIYQEVFAYGLKNNPNAIEAGDADSIISMAKSIIKTNVTNIMKSYKLDGHKYTISVPCTFKSIRSCYLHDKIGLIRFDLYQSTIDKMLHIIVTKGSHVEARRKFIGYEEFKNTESYHIINYDAEEE